MSHSKKFHRVIRQKLLALNKNWISTGFVVLCSWCLLPLKMASGDCDVTCIQPVSSNASHRSMKNICMFSHQLISSITLLDCGTNLFKHTHTTLNTNTKRSWSASVEYEENRDRDTQREGCAKKKQISDGKCRIYKTMNVLIAKFVKQTDKNCTNPAVKIVFFLFLFILFFFVTNQCLFYFVRIVNKENIRAEVSTSPPARRIWSIMNNVSIICHHLQLRPHWRPAKEWWNRWRKLFCLLLCCCSITLQCSGYENMTQDRLLVELHCQRCYYARHGQQLIQLY